MYVDFFGLRELPFNNTPDPRFFYPTPDHEEALASLIYAVQSRKGFVLLTGEVGAGKTLVSRLMLRRVGTQVAFANINHSVQSAHDLMEALCTEFELPLPKSSTHAKLVRVLHDFLLEQFAQNIPVVLILDEAQNLPDEAFEQLRMIGNLEADDAKLLQICIVGQPELKTRFAAPSLRQLRQRLYRTFHIPALDRKATEEYMRHRMSVSGGRLEDIFTTEAIDEVAALSRGLPRLINTICDNAMLSAYAADQRSIDGPFVRAVSAQMMLIDTEENQAASRSTHISVRPQEQGANHSDMRAESRSRRAARESGAAPSDPTRQLHGRTPPPRSTAVLRSNRPPDVRELLVSATGTQSILSVLRNELARLRADVSREVGITTRRVEALDRRLAMRERTFRTPPRPETDVSPVLIRAAAIIERSAAARRASQDLQDGQTRGGAEAATKSPPLSDAENGDLGRVAAPSAEDVAAVVNHLDADARTANSLLRAWRTGEARRSSREPSPSTVIPQT